MSETDRTPKTDADAALDADMTLNEAAAQIARDRAKAAELDEELNKLEKEVLPEHPEPDHVDQAAGT